MKNYVPSHLKDMNRQIVYQIIKEKETTSKAELAKLTGISSPTVIKIVNFLIEKKLVIEVGQGDFSQSEVSVGRKPRMLKLNTGLMYVAAFFLEGDFLSMGVVDLADRIIYKKSMEITPDFSFIMPEILNRLVKQLLEEAGISESQLFGIGIALPVAYDEKKCTIITAPLIQVNEPLVIRDEIGKLEDKYKAIVMIENDANAQVLGEFQRAGYSEKEDLVFISIGTGLGAGIVLNGQLRRGKHHMCGEIGYICFLGDDIERKKNAGWLESQISYRVLEEKFGVDFSNGSGLDSDTKKKLIEYVALPIALCINNTTMLLDCGNIVLGGIVTEVLGEDLLTEVKKHVEQMSLTDSSIRLQSSSDSGLTGIASMVTKKKIVELLTLESD